MVDHPLYKTAPAEVHKTLGRWILTDGFPFVYDPERSHDAFIVDAVTGDEYLDLFSFFASMPLGHNHPGMHDPEFLARLQLAAVVKPSNSDIYTPAMADFVATMGRTMPEPFVHMFFIEGGALAVENALKVAFDWKVRKNMNKGLIPREGDQQLGTQVIHFRTAFHGRSGYTLSLTNGFSLEKTHYFPKFPWPRVTTPSLRFPTDEHNLAATTATEQLSLSEIRKAFADNPNDIAAIIIETIQGEGGDNHFRPEFFRALRQLCDEHEAMLIFDEIQCGMGMTGKWWAFEHYDVAPDIFSFGKKAQVCGIAVTKRVDEVASCFQVPSRINSTWGGNLVDMVRCTRYIELIEQEDLLANAAEVGGYLHARLLELQESYRLVSNVRGRGLMCAFDLPNTAQRARLLQLLAQRKVLLLPAGSQSIRFRPALDTRREHIDLAISKIEQALDQLLS
ncbi:L-lysine 6-transaminase [Paraliomyxa miuraensis]|uniref:L-lysine 6-transaminase n=1 Tax=Paraliomyxa miuraensis TaxID=376150 RepID=UPI00224F2A12|nr:L-lysine 6-transaminase [Paraliomyxa miuraensis]MCX4240781.1 L-lysine 6-transaminase [Paraliomyxa miuraensis]